MRTTFTLLTVLLLAPLAALHAADLTQDSPITFPAKGALPAKYPPDRPSKMRETPEPDYSIFASPERSLEQIATIQAEIERRPDQSGQFALFHGPWLLQIDRVTSPVFFESGYGQNRVVLPSFESEGDVALEPVRATEVPIGLFRVPVARFKLTFIPGGFRSQPLTATLSAAAERTEQDAPPLAEFWLEPRKAGETFTNY